jgi:hypothetical protein
MLNGRVSGCPSLGCDDDPTPSGRSEEFRLSEMLYGFGAAIPNSSKDGRRRDGGAFSVRGVGNAILLTPVMEAVDMSRCASSWKGEGMFDIMVESGGGEGIVSAKASLPSNGAPSGVNRPVLTSSMASSARNSGR